MFIYCEVLERQSQSNWFGSLAYRIIEMVGTRAPNFRRRKTKHWNGWMNMGALFIAQCIAKSRGQLSRCDLSCIANGSVYGKCRRYFEKIWKFRCFDVKQLAAPNHQRRSDRDPHAKVLRCHRILGNTRNPQLMILLIDVGKYFRCSFNRSACDVEREKKLS